MHEGTWIEKVNLAKLFREFAGVEFKHYREEMIKSFHSFIDLFVKLFFPRKSGEWFLANVYLDTPNPMAAKLIAILEGMLKNAVRPAQL
jgi:hypothetical protein